MAVVAQERPTSRLISTSACAPGLLHAQRMRLEGPGRVALQDLPRPRRPGRPSPTPSARSRRAARARSGPAPRRPQPAARAPAARHAARAPPTRAPARASRADEPRRRGEERDPRDVGAVVGLAVVRAITIAVASSASPRTSAEAARGSGSRRPTAYMRRMTKSTGVTGVCSGTPAAVPATPARRPTRSAGIGAVRAEDKGHSLDREHRHGRSPGVEILGEDLDLHRRHDGGRDRDVDPTDACPPRAHARNATGRARPPHRPALRPGLHPWAEPCCPRDPPPRRPATHPGADVPAARRS